MKTMKFVFFLSVIFFIAFDINEASYINECVSETSKCNKISKYWGPTKKRPEQTDTAWSSPTQPGAVRQEYCTVEQTDTVFFSNKQTDLHCSQLFGRLIYFRSSKLVRCTMSF